MELQLNDFISMALEPTSSIEIWGTPGEWLLRIESTLPETPSYILARQRGGLRFFKTLDAAYNCITAELEFASIKVVNHTTLHDYFNASSAMSKISRLENFCSLSRDELYELCESYSVPVKHLDYIVAVIRDIQSGLSSRMQARALIEKRFNK